MSTSPRSAALAVALLAAAADAKEVGRDGKGGLLEASGFYKSLLSGVLLVPPEGAVVATPSSGHIVRVASRFLFEDRVEVDVAYQIELALGLINPLGSTVGGTGAGASRRLVPLGGELAPGLVHQLDRASLKLALPFGDLTVGRQVLSWGTGRLWNPTDVLSPFPPTAIDREVRRGFDAVRLAVALGDVTQLDALWLPQVRAEDNGGVLRFQTNVHGWDGSLSFGKYVQDFVAGFDLAGDVGPVGVHAEGAYTLEWKDYASVGDHFFRGVVGFDLKPHEKLVLVAEYSFNGYGTTNPAEYAAIRLSPRAQRGEIFGVGMHQAAVAASWLANDLVTATLSLLANLKDPSVLVIPSVEWSVSQTVLLRGGAYVPVGRIGNSEYPSSAFGAFVLVGVYVP